MSNKARIMPPKTSVGEEIANSVTHGIGALLSIAGTVLLVVRAAMHGSAIHVVSFAIYGMTLILMHTSSTLYHALHAPRAKRVFWVFDHASIYLLIAGTYTPFMLIPLWGAWGLSLMIAIWMLTLLGIVFKSLFIGRLRKSSTALYVLMGWLIVVAAQQFWLHISHQSLAFLAAGGLSYMLGIVFYCWKRMPFGHMIWHLFVLGGSVCHYFAIYWYLLPVN
ncbi:hemolysin III family protein [Candidatus Bipolaricaulota bacterium]|nr:hemolysin III family protein [Candidatus Bipolaricaulota bacterium]